MSTKSGNPADAMWEAMEQLRSEFTKRVGPRMGRGDVRAAVLALLQEEPMHGYQIIREIGERTGGRWRPSAGSVYPTLQLLADEGLVTSATENDRKVYSLTAEAEAEATVAAASAPWVKDEKEDGHFGPVPKAGVDLAQAAAQAARTGTADQQREVADLLDSTRRKIYSILAQD
ncbi:PadR family transcriptional regulator [uncultured Demequina sp.]|uniref:PadR family transcriptional regulator n=1 Tax=uncultured Demequina sp. TaxID=693499 RepID=UPI0025F4D22C|nr:PadR family transcriptional regulator [uncultured Demequina sp.]